MMMYDTHTDDVLPDQEQKRMALGYVQERP